MFESTHSYHPLYKPKQHFAHYNKLPDIQNECYNNIDLTYCNSEDDQSTSKSNEHYHDYLSQSIYQQKTEANFQEKQIAPLLKTKNRKTSSPTTVNILCLVCGDQSSGLHYGVHTCEGCKGFFRRSINQRISHRCNHMNNCEITPLNRNSCQYCRLKKCIDVGMSRDASRLGRPPKRSRSETKNMIIHIKDSNIHKHKHSFNSTFPDCLFEHRQRIFIPEIHQEILRKLSSMLIYQERLLTDIETKEIDYISEVIISAHLQFCIYTSEKLQNKIEQNRPILADSMSNDLNYDPALVWTNWQLSFPFESILRIFKCYTFSQQISHNDQICLFRHGAFETILVSWFILFDREQNLMLTPDFSAYMDRDFIKTIKTLGLFMLEIFDLGMKANHFRWTDSDIALFSALLFMNPERPDLGDRERIEQIETKLMQVFYRHLRRHYPNEPNLFLNVLQLIPSIQEVNQIHLNAIRYIKQHKPHIFNSLPDFYREIYQGLSPYENNF